MSYLDDPRVFLAAERTLLAWIRTEISILALLFLLRKFGLEAESETPYLNWAINVICILVVGMAVTATVQAYFTLSKLGPLEKPSKYATHIVLLTGVVSIVICVGGAWIVMAV